MLTLSAIQRKQQKISVIPVGLSSPIDEQNIQTIIKNLDNYLFDDVMLLVWCKRRTFYSREAKNDDEKNMIPSFFRHWIQLYLKKPDEVRALHLSTIPKYGSWGDLNTIYICASQMASVFSNELALFANLKEACVKMIGNQLKHDYEIVSKQPEEMFKSQEWISNCANEAPRISNNHKKSITGKDFQLFSSSS